MAELTLRDLAVGRGGPSTNAYGIQEDSMQAMSGSAMSIQQQQPTKFDLPDGLGKGTATSPVVNPSSLGKVVEYDNNDWAQNNLRQQASQQHQQQQAGIKSPFLQHRNIQSYANESTQVFADDDIDYQDMTRNNRGDDL